MFIMSVIFLEFVTSDVRILFIFMYLYIPYNFTKLKRVHVSLLHNDTMLYRDLDFDRFF
jgi:hypothetical protein